MQSLKEIGNELQPLGTLLYEDVTEPDNSSNWQPHRIIWKVIAHRECQDYPNAPIDIRNALGIATTEPLI